MAALMGIEVKLKSSRQIFLAALEMRHHVCGKVWIGPRKLETFPPVDGKFAVEQNQCGAISRERLDFVLLNSLAPRPEKIRVPHR